jgi:hypothetical protein
MVNPPKIKMTDEGEMVARLEDPIDCPWRTVDPKQRMFECHMPNGPPGKRGCPEFDCFPAGCPMIDGVTVKFITDD